MSECKHPGCPRPTRTAGYCNLAQLETAAKASYDALKNLPPVAHMAAWEDLSIDVRQANLDTMRAGLEAIGIEVEP